MLAKLVPVIYFCCMCFICFHPNFCAGLLGKFSYKHYWNTSIIEQLQGTVLVTVWVFIDVEEAVSERADDGKILDETTILDL